MAWRRRAARGVALVLAIPVAVFAWRMAPLVRDGVLMDKIVVQVALDWRDHGRDRAWQTLQFELDHQGISENVGEGDCTLEEEAQRGRSVRCAWSVAVRLPWMDRTWPLSFVSEATIDLHGVLVL